MSIDFTDTNKLLNKIRFYVEFDINKQDDLELIDNIIKEIKKKNENCTNN
jgi:hypothetical protein